MKGQLFVTNQTQDIPSFLLAPQQERVFARAEGAATQAVALLPADLAAADLEAALRKLVERHEILRTTFVRLPGLRVPQQAVQDELPPSWAVIPAGADLDGVLAAEAEALDHERGPALRAARVELPDGAALALTAPAACLDAHSIGLLLRELAAVVRGTDAGDEPLQYADYAEWRRQLVEDDPAGAEAARAWWDADPAPLAGPLLFGRVGASSEERRRLAFPLPAGAAASLAEAAESSRSTPAVFLEACLHALVSRLTGEQELTLAGLADGRGQPDLAGAVGPYAQLVPVRSRVDGQTTFAELVDQVGRARADAARWQDFASAQQLEQVAGAAVGFAFYDITDGNDLERLTTIAATPLEVVVKHGHEVSFEISYDSSVYDEDDVRRLASAFTALVGSAVADGTQPVSGLSLLGATERAEVLALSDGGNADVPAETVRQAFEAWARKAPDALAVTDGSMRLSYDELNVASNRLAHLLRARGINGGTVALFLDRSADALVAILGILKAGAAFVPLNVEHPASRLEHQLREAETAAAVTRADLLDRLPDVAEIVVCLDRDSGELAAQPGEDPEETAGPDDVAYVMYTSGSTGLPKGVAVTHGNVANYAARLIDRLGDVQGLRFAVVSALSTDLGYTSIFPAIAGGGAVHLVPPDVVLDPDAYASFAADAGIDVLKITPSLLGALLAGRGADVLPRRWLVCGGEAFTLDLLARIRAAGGTCRILNHYGPTETTIGTCALEVDGDVDPASATVPIGRPFPNARAYVVDASGEPTPVGVVGELLIGGRGVARGYVNRPDETAERFAADPFADGARVYRTGDRARWLRDGTIEFLGRVDEQVKIRGYRVEPGEIEAALLRHDAVRQAAVVVQHSEGEARLAAYVVASPRPTPEALRGFLADWVPEYMLPTITFSDVLPLTPSGKIDRQALAAQHAVEETGSDYVAPRNDLEREIAEIWQELLGVERVGVTDDFFALGGHSLLATQMITRIRRRHGNVPLRALFSAPTVSGLAEAVGAASATPEAS
jgi:amino acid adenylation domain-containing protein